MSSSDTIIIEKLTRLIEENLADSSFSLDTVYKELGVSKTQLHRIIKEQTQLSTSLFIRSVRLQKAKQLLDSTDLRVTEIASLVGIDSPPNFSKYFIQTYGISPSDYRKQVAESPDNKPLTTQTIFQPFTPKPLFKIAYLWGGLGVLVLLFGLVLWKIEGTPAPESQESFLPHYDNSIVVLPFKSLNNNPTFAEGVLDQIHSSLSLIENLKVISQSSANQYRDSDKNNWQIGDELDVAYLLKGTVQEQNNRVETVLSLVRAQDDIQVWSHRYEGELPQLFNLTTAMVKDVVVQLKQKITPSLSQKLDRVPTRSLDAYHEFLVGRTLLITRTKENLAASLAQFDKALALDPGFAEALAYKALAYQLTGNMGYQDLNTCFELCEQHALKAIQIDPNNSAAYAVLGNSYRDHFKWQQSKTAYEISLKYRPNDAQTLYWYSLLLRSTGQVNESLRYSTKARLLDPLYPVILAGHIINCMYAERDDLAQKAIAEGKAMFDKSFVYYMALGEYEMYHEHYDKALQAFEKMKQLNASMKYGNVSSAYCAAKLGDPAPTRSLLQQMGNQAQDFVGKSMLYAGLGNKDSSLICLEKAASMGRISSEILVSCDYRSIRQDPRFKAVLKQYGLPTTSPVQ